MGFLQDAINYARFEAGRIVACEMTDQDIINNILDTVVEEFSELCPVPGEHTLTVVDGQTLYDIPNANINMIDNFEPLESLDVATNIIGPGFGFEWPGHGSHEGYYSTAEAGALARAHIRALVVEEIYIEGNKVRVLPTPDRSASLTLYTQDYWSFADEDAYDTIPRRLRLCFKYVLCARIANAMANERATLSQVGVGASRIKIEWQNLVKLSEKMMAQARAKASTKPELIA